MRSSSMGVPTSELGHKAEAKSAPPGLGWLFFSWAPGMARIRHHGHSAPMERPGIPSEETKKPFRVSPARELYVRKTCRCYAAAWAAPGHPRRSTRPELRRVALSSVRPGISQKNNASTLCPDGCCGRLRDASPTGPTPSAPSSSAMANSTLASWKPICRCCTWPSRRRALSSASWAGWTAGARRNSSGFPRLARVQRTGPTPFAWSTEARAHMAVHLTPLILPSTNGRVWTRRERGFRLARNHGDSR